MIPDEDAPPFPRTHNLPPDMRVEALAELRRFLNDVEQEGGKTFAERRAEFLRSLGNAIVRDRDTVAASTDVIRMAGEVRKLIEDARITRSNPFRQTADSLKGVADEFWGDVDGAVALLRERINEWTAEEDERIADQNRAAMAFMRGTPAPAIAVRQVDDCVTTVAAVRAEDTMPPPSAPVLPARRRAIRGDLGGEVKAVDVKVYTITDFALLPDYILKAPVVVDAIKEVAKAFNKHMPEIPGITITTTTANRFK